MPSELITEGPLKGWYQLIPRINGTIIIGDMEIKSGKTNFKALKKRQKERQEQKSRLKKLRKKYGT